MDSNTARAILSEVAAGGWLDKAMPEDELDLSDLAQYYYEEAKLIKEEGMDSEHIDAIIALATTQVSPPVLSEVAVHNHDGTPPGEINPDIEYEITLPPEKVAKTYPRRSSGGYSESDLREADGLPLPQPIPETALDMPVDLTEIGDKAVRRLYSAFTIYYNRARWMLATATSNLANATHLKDEAYRVGLKEESNVASLKEEKVTKDILEARAKGKDDYKEWAERVLKHEQEVIHWRALYDIYGKNVEVLSREWTMRTEQYERER